MCPENQWLEDVSHSPFLGDMLVFREGKSGAGLCLLTYNLDSVWGKCGYKHLHLRKTFGGYKCGNKCGKYHTLSVFLEDSLPIQKI